MKLSGKTAIVTGAAQGIGRTIAIELARAGANLVLVDLEDTFETAKQIDPQGTLALGVRADISIASEVYKVIEFTTEKLGRIDILVNNAGRQTWSCDGEPRRTHGAGIDWHNASAGGRRIRYCTA